MDKWVLDIKLNSRTDLMKICEMLGRAIGKDTIADKRINIMISGGVEAGKSAISDGLAAALSDELEPYHLMRSPLIEKFAGEARERKSYKMLPVNGESAVFSLLHYISERDMDYPHRDLNYKSKPSQGGIDFVTACGSQPRDKGDISICFRRDMSCSYGQWPRKLQIVIREDSLKTKNMAETFKHLKSFHERRQARLQTKEQHIDGPA